MNYPNLGVIAFIERDKTVAADILAARPVWLRTDDEAHVFIAVHAVNENGDIRAEVIGAILIGASGVSSEREARWRNLFVFSAVVIAPQVGVKALVVVARTLVVNGERYGAL